MIRVVFERDGVVSEAMAAEGRTLLSVAQEHGQPLEGTCGGDMACATCHVVIDPADFSRLSAASAEEEDMLDLAPGAGRTSRLACQLVLTAGLDGLRVRVA
ncbi:ferredoxin [Sphingomonas jinjuensis]|uniref:Ferredoxin n=1 Tax=Sphingomonas jinjuensis TaxID=535907 RepID=A0A840FBE7_9SPHN|nr:2Fe-2S iron-sulfur cluster-binding protein [Sphingomonas jinjuensis]MBB4152857.1 ferredoxin [Sphingomonas jinjuensis]